MYYGSALYLLTRLLEAPPVSALAPQSLPLAVAGSLNNFSAAALSENGGVRSNAFVGDISVSITQSKASLMLTARKRS